MNTKVVNKLKWLLIILALAVVLCWLLIRPSITLIPSEYCTRVFGCEPNEFNTYKNEIGTSSTLSFTVNNNLILLATGKQKDNLCEQISPLKDMDSDSPFQISDDLSTVTLYIEKNMYEYTPLELDELTKQCDIIFSKIELIQIFNKIPAKNISTQYIELDVRTQTIIDSCVVKCGERFAYRIPNQ